MRDGSRARGSFAARVRRDDGGGEPRRAARRVRRRTGAAATEEARRRRAAAGGGETAPAETAPGDDRGRRRGPDVRSRLPSPTARSWPSTGWATRQERTCGATYINGEYGQRSPLKFEFLEDDQQALAKVASGYNPDLIHPCIAYIEDWEAAGLIQPFDTALLPGFEGIPEAIRAGGVFDGQVYNVPLDMGFSSLTYRADKMPLAEGDSPGTSFWIGATRDGSPCTRTA